MPIVTLLLDMIGIYHYHRGMAPRVRHKGTRSPSAVSPPHPTFLFVGDAARVLRCHDLTYSQLRRLFDMVAPDRAAADRARTRKPARKGTRRGTAWARYTFEDLAAVRAAISLLRAGPAGRGGRLRIGYLERVCAQLRRPPYGLRNPVIDGSLRWVGTSLVAEVTGLLMEPGTRQSLFESVARDAEKYAARRGLRIAAELRGTRWRPGAAHRTRERSGAVSAFVSLEPPSLTAARRRAT